MNDKETRPKILGLGICWPVVVFVAVIGMLYARRRGDNNLLYAI